MQSYADFYNAYSLFSGFNYESQNNFTNVVTDIKVNLGDVTTRWNYYVFREFAMIFILYIPLLFLHKFNKSNKRAA